MTRIIAIEGIDASGKATQTDLLADHLRADGLSVEIRSFPRYESFFGSRIRALLDGNEPVTAQSLDAQSMALWFAMDRWHSFTNPSDADVLLLNRYVLSNAVYQSARLSDADGDALFAWVIDLEHAVLKLPHPDVTIVLDVDVATSTHRAASRAEAAGETPDVYEQSRTLLTNSRQRYISAGDHVPNVHVIEVTGRNAPDIGADVYRLTK